MEFLSNLIFYVVPFLIVLTVVVFVHEFGHYYIARRNGVRIEAFSIGFGQELFGWNDSQGTRWKFCLIPLGGYVKMLGDADAASATVDQQTAMSEDSFPAKSVGQRAAIVFAGPGANFLFSILVFALLFVFVGRPFTPPVVAELREDGPAASAGLLPGDRILSVDGEVIETIQQLQGIVHYKAEIPLQFEVERDGSVFEAEIVPELREITDRFNSIQRVGLIGISATGTEIKPVGVVEALVGSVQETYELIAGTLRSLWEIIIGVRSAEDLGGPIRIAQISGDTAQYGIIPVVRLIAFLSVSLGLINLFPIPVLDGGHLVLYTIEAARGRPLTERTQEIAFRIGLAVVLSLMLFVTWNDLVQLEVIQNLTALFS